jgi:triacylglycerol lipase
MGEIALTAFLLLLALPLCLSCLTYAFFWYETANSAYLQQLERLSGGRIKRWIAKGILTSSASMILTVLLYPFGFRKGLLRPPGNPDSSSPPIILVHGLYHNASAWILYRMWLKRAGFGNTYAINYSSLRCTFRQAVEQLNASIEEVARLHPGHRVVLIGHSLGGLLSRLCVERENQAEKTAAIITLGTPHHGSKLAVLGPGRLAGSIIYQGPLFREIERDAPPCSVPGLSLYSAVDNMVLPNDALQIDRPGWTRELVSPISHVSMLFHRATAMRVIEFIKDLP